VREKLMRGDDRRQVIKETSRRRNQGDDVLWEQTKESTGRKHQAEVMKRGIDREIVEEIGNQESWRGNRQDAAVRGTRKQKQTNVTQEASCQGHQGQQEVTGRYPRGS